MATTTNYGWTTPDDTALVKDGASAIRTLGTSVDTTTKNLNPSTTLGDIEYRSSTANTNTRVGIGSSGQALTVVAGVPSWAASATSTLTTTGDTIYASAANTLARRAIGSTGDVLTVSGGLPTWAAPAAGGGFTSIATGSLSGTTTTISSIVQTYKHLYLVVKGAQLVTTAALPCFRLNGDSSSIYSNFRITYDSTVVNASGALAFIRTSGSNIPLTSNSRTLVLYIENYTQTQIKPITSRFASDTSGGDSCSIVFSNYNSTTAITSIGITTDTAQTFNAGTYILYGVN